MRWSLAHLRSVLRRLPALATALLVLVSAVSAGRGYLWCSMMERAVDACCCEPEGDEHEATGREPQLHAGCCEDRAIGELDRGQPEAAGIDVPPATLVTLPGAAPPPPSPAPLALAPPPPASTCASPIRAGPFTAADTCARLQVYHC